MTPVWILLVLAVLVLAYGVFQYNRLVALSQRVKNGWSEIDVQLRRRYDLIPNVIQTVKGYAAHERELFERITQARTQGMQATGVGDKAGAENQITAGLKSLFAVAEAYPELKANQNFLALQEELSATESKIAYARQFYNDQVMLLNTKVQSFPSSIIASLFHYTTHEFFNMDDAARGPIQVGF